MAFEAILHCHHARSHGQVVRIAPTKAQNREPGGNCHKEQR
jgi:hypothetical protein